MLSSTFYPCDVVMSLSAEELRNQFMSWQCRIRQYAVRKAEGRPSSGMQANIVFAGDRLLEDVTMLINKVADDSYITEFKFMVQKTHDPKDRRENALKVFSERYYQMPETFDDKPTALFAAKSPAAANLLAAGQCELRIKQANQHYYLNCQINQEAQDSELYQSTYWHNYLFNAGLPGDALVLSFTPDWSQSRFEQVSVVV